VTVAGREMVRIAALGDLHCKHTSANVLQPIFRAAGEEADVLLLCGDLTDRGLPEEAHVLAHELTTAVNIPVVVVLGNHDYESGQEHDVTQILVDAGITVLEGDACEVAGIGIAGVKGFAGGFGARTLQPWGESMIKQFVHTTVEDSLRLESALAKLRTPSRVVALHYSPIRGTVEGEPLEIFPFLGSSRLEEPISRFPVCSVFHGHAHHGTLEGRTMSNVPVYNVAAPLLARAFPNRQPFRVVEVPLHDRADESSNGHDGHVGTGYRVMMDVDR
jgi:Icc-related predicted phosphoesterase